MRTRVERLGGTEGNEILTSATAVLLTLLLVAEGVTIVLIGDLLSAHMFIGMVLIPPVLLKLGSTGYRFARYYTGPRVYRERGPPPLLLRALAPPFIVWGACFGVHFLARLPETLRSLRTGWTRSGRRRVAGAQLRL